MDVGWQYNPEVRGLALETPMIHRTFYENGVSRITSSDWVVAMFMRNIALNFLKSARKSKPKLGE